MSQKTIFIVLIAIILVVNHADSKRVGCANFGHSCYGGFGKRSLIASLGTDSNQQLDNIPSDHAGNMPTLKTAINMPFQRHFQGYRPDVQQPENIEQEKELKIVILSTLNQVIEDTVKRISNDYESN